MAALQHLLNIFGFQKQFHIINIVVDRNVLIWLIIMALFIVSQSFFSVFVFTSPIPTQLNGRAIENSNPY